MAYFAHEGQHERYLIVAKSSLVPEPKLVASDGRGQRPRLQPITDHFSLITGHHGLGCGVGRGLGRGVGLGVAVGVGVDVGVGLGVTVGVGVAVGVGVG